MGAEGARVLAEGGRGSKRKAEDDVADEVDSKSKRAKLSGGSQEHVNGAVAGATGAAHAGTRGNGKEDAEEGCAEAGAGNGWPAPEAQELEADGGNVGHKFSIFDDRYTTAVRMFSISPTLSLSPGAFRSLRTFCHPCAKC